MIKSLKRNLLFIKLIGSIFLLLLIRLPSEAQTDSTAFIPGQFEKYKEQSVQEKIFVHVDRASYLAGEIMWFKIYCTDASSNSLLNLSKVVYVEVLDKDQQPVLQAKIALKDGVGNGSLVLPATIHSGNFIFRAYTNLMKNLDPEFYFHQNITIINTISNDTLSTQKIEGANHVQFFPEGGDLVNGLKSRVAFLVTNSAGRGIDCNGIITDDNNDTLLRFRPLKFGMGSFVFTPKSNVNYKAIITTAKGNIVQNLPTVLITGFVINVSDPQKNGHLKVNVQTNTDNKSAYLFIHTRHKVKASQLLTFLGGKSDFEIDTSSLDDGISHITLFDKNNQPVAERLYFKPPHQQLFIEASADNKEYTARKKVNIAVTSKDENNKQPVTEMSMAVFLTDSLSIHDHDIFNYLWLSSDLKGKVESPGYYLNNIDSEVNEATDNLMLTHGWRRFIWTEILTDQKPVLKFLPEFEGHIVSGKIINRANETPVENMIAFLSVPGTHFKLYTSRSNANGTVNFNTKDFFGNRLVVAGVDQPDTYHYRVELADPFSDKFSSEKTPPFVLAKTASSALIKQSIQMQVQNIYAGAKLNLFETPKADTNLFYGKAEAKYMLDDYTRFPTMEEVLREYVREINVRKKRDEFFLTMVNKDEDGNAEVKNPVILLDGIPQFDNGNKITHYDPLKVNKLETIQQAYFLGPARFDGIASFFTYNGDMEGFQIDSASTVLDYDALQLRREFYTPSYETAEKLSSRLPDFRSLLYWSPGLKTDVHGKAEISFYTSDVPGKYAVVLQGISAEGKAASKVFTFEVKKNSSDKK